MRNAFHKLAHHRGIWHSILAALFCAVATAVVFANVFDRHAGVAWLAGGFMFIGYLVHLTLDEIYSVDVMDTRIKASFGTAMKLFDRRYPYASARHGCSSRPRGLACPFADGLCLRPVLA